MRVLACALSIFAFAAVPVNAHHSFAEFDLNKTLEFAGTIHEFQWTSPHSWVEVLVVDAAGKTVQWSLETANPAGLARRGWTRNSLKPGDKVTVRLHPRRDGAPVGDLVSVTTADGKVVGQAAGGGGRGGQGGGAQAPAGE